MNKRLKSEQSKTMAKTFEVQRIKKKTNNKGKMVNILGDDADQIELNRHDRQLDQVIKHEQFNLVWYAS